MNTKESFPEMPLDKRVEAWLSKMGLDFNPFAHAVAEQEEHLMRYVVDPNGVLQSLSKPEDGIAYIGACCGKTTAALTVDHLLGKNYGRRRAGAEAAILFPIVWNMRDIVTDMKEESNPYNAELYQKSIGRAAVNRGVDSGIEPASCSTFAGLLEEVRQERGQTPVIVVDGVEWLVDVVNPAAMDDQREIVRALAPLLEHPVIARGEIMLKLFLPPAVEALLEQDYPDFCGRAVARHMVWTTDNLAKLIGQRVGAAGGDRSAAPPRLDYLSNQSVPIKVDYWLIEQLGAGLERMPTPREAVLTVNEVFARHMINEDPGGKLTRKDFEQAVEYIVGGSGGS